MISPLCVPQGTFSCGFAAIHLERHREIELCPISRYHDLAPQGAFSFACGEIHLAAWGRVIRVSKNGFYEAVFRI